MMLLNSFLLSSSLSSLQDIWMFKQWQTFNFFYLFWKLILPDTFKQSNISSNEMYKVLFVGSYCGHHNTKPVQKSPLHSPDKKSNYIRLRCEYMSTLRRGWDVFTSFLLHIFNNFFLSHPKKKQLYSPNCPVMFSACIKIEVYTYMFKNVRNSERVIRNAYVQ